MDLCCVAPGPRLLSSTRPARRARCRTRRARCRFDRSRPAGLRPRPWIEVRALARPTRRSTCCWRSRARVRPGRSRSSACSRRRSSGAFSRPARRPSGAPDAAADLSKVRGTPSPMAPDVYLHLRDPRGIGPASARQPRSGRRCHPSVSAPYVMQGGWTRPCRRVSRLPE